MRQRSEGLSGFVKDNCFIYMPRSLANTIYRQQPFYACSMHVQSCARTHRRHNPEKGWVYMCSADMHRGQECNPHANQGMCAHHTQSRMLSLALNIIVIEG